MNAIQTNCPPVLPTAELFKLDDLLVPDRRAEWETLLRTFDHPNKLQQSPEWLEHQQSIGAGEQFSAVGMRDIEGRLYGLVPLGFGHWNLDYSLKVINLWRTRLCCINILGSLPLLPPNVQTYDKVFQCIHNSFPHYDCILMRMLPTDSFLYRYLHESKFISDHFLCYVPDGLNVNHFISLPASFEEYLTKFNSKKRYNLKRQIRMLREHGGGRLSMRRIEQSRDVPFFVDGADYVVQRSWQGARSGEELIDRGQKWQRMLTDLADRGILRSYLLLCADKPCAYVLGYQFRGVFYYVQIGYDQALSQYSPGTSLLYMLIEDLIVYNKASLLTFGFGDNNYKQEFGNLRSQDALMILLRKNGLNRSRRFFHSAFRKTGQSLRKYLRRCKSSFSRIKELAAFRSSKKTDRS